MRVINGLRRFWRSRVLAEAVAPVVARFRGQRRWRRAGFRVEQLEQRLQVAGPLVLGGAGLSFDGPWQDLFQGDAETSLPFERERAAGAGAGEAGGVSSGNSFAPLPASGGGGGSGGSGARPVRGDGGTRGAEEREGARPAGRRSGEAGSGIGGAVGATGSPSSSSTEGAGRVARARRERGGGGDEFLGDDSDSVRSGGVRESEIPPPPRSKRPRAERNGTSKDQPKAGNEVAPSAPKAPSNVSVGGGGTGGGTSTTGNTSTGGTGGTSTGTGTSQNNTRNNAGGAGTTNTATPKTVVPLPCENGLEGWTVVNSGAASASPVRVEAVGGGFVLREGDSFLVAVEREITVPENPGQLVFAYEDLAFDTTDPDSIHDAFEAALVDATGKSVVYTIGANKDAFLNVTESFAALTATGVQDDERGVALDISHLVPGTKARIVLRLINNDSDAGTSVRIQCRPDEPPTVSAALAHDATPPGVAEPYDADGLTNDARVSGVAGDDRGVTKLEAQIDGGAFTDVTAILTSGGAFTYDPRTLAAGAHRITMRMTDAVGQTAVAGVDFVVNAPPTPDAGGDRHADEGDTVGFDAAGSTDAEGIFSYGWTFQDGSTADGPIASFAYPQDGTYPVTLTVTDTAGAVVSDVISVVVGNVAPAVMAVGVERIEGSRVEFVGSFTDLGVLDAHTAWIDWGDGTSGPGTVSESGGQGTVSASHLYADNGDYPIRLIVRDDSSEGEARAVATIGNVAPTLAVGYSFQPIEMINAPGGGDGLDVVFGGRLGTVVSGRFTDPGFTRASAGTAETFTVTIDWGDGTVETVPATVVQGGEGVATSGTFSAVHAYRRAGFFGISVTVTDDDGGSDAEQFRFGIGRIDVVPTLNLKAGGEIPVKIFRDPAFDPRLFDPASLLFGPAGARESHGALHADGGFAVLTHFGTQASGIRPTDSVAFLTGTLRDGTPFVGMDFIEIAPGSEQGSNGVVPVTGPVKFFVVDPDADRVFRYTPGGRRRGPFMPTHCQATRGGSRRTRRGTRCGSSTPRRTKSSCRDRTGTSSGRGWRRDSSRPRGLRRTARTCGSWTRRWGACCTTWTRLRGEGGSGIRRRDSRCMPRIRPLAIS